MQSALIKPPSQTIANEPSQKRSLAAGYPRPIRVLFYVFAFYLVLPLIDFPVLGLSLSAPLFFVVAIVCMVNPPQPWFRQSQQWMIFAVLIWGGVFIATAGNGLLSGGVDINSDGILTVVRYAYWLLVFVVTTHFAAQEDVMKRTARLLGRGIFFLALLRWGEAIFYGKIGAWTETILLSQNDYGFLFSTFSPFLLVLLLQEKGLKFLRAVIANMALWGAVAINGSRGSWVAMGIGLTLALYLLFVSRPRKFMGLLAGALFVGGISAVLMIGAPRFSNAVLNRFETFGKLDTDKSYAIRQLMNQKAILLFKESPLIGVGAARFRLSVVPLNIPQVLSYASQAHFDRKSPHNSYLSFLAEDGLVGAVPYVLLLVALGGRAFKLQRRLIRQDEFWGMAVFIGFVQMSIHMWVIASLANTVNWFVYGLVGAMIIARRVREIR